MMRIALHLMIFTPFFLMILAAEAYQEALKGVQHETGSPKKKIKMDMVKPRHPVEEGTENELKLYSFFSNNLQKVHYMERYKRTPGLEEIKDTSDNVNGQAESAEEIGKEKIAEKSEDVKEKIESGKEVAIGAMGNGMAKVEDAREKGKGMTDSLPKMPGRKKRSPYTEATKGVIKKRTSNAAAVGIQTADHIVALKEK